MPSHMVYKGPGGHWFVGRPVAVHLIAGQVTGDQLDGTLGLYGIERKDLVFEVAEHKADFEAEFGGIS